MSGDFLVFLPDNPEIPENPENPESPESPESPEYPEYPEIQSFPHFFCHPPFHRRRRKMVPRKVSSVAMAIHTPRRP